MRRKTFGLLGGGLLCAVLTALVALCCLPATAHADESNKTLTVDQNASETQGETYTDIQSAINYVNEQDDKTGWTIEIQSGEYARFAVLDGMDNMTVKAADNADVVVSTFDGTEPPADTAEWQNRDGVHIGWSDNVTIQGITFITGNSVTDQLPAVISNRDGHRSAKYGFNVVGCTFLGNGSVSAIMFENNSDKFAVTGSSFANFAEAISLYGDSTVLKAGNITGNSFTDCSFAVHGYYDPVSGGTLTIANNTITGSDSLRCKIVLQDQTNRGSIKVDIHDNVLASAVIGLVNFSESGETISDPLTSNTFEYNSFYVTANEPGQVDAYATYLAPEGSNGYWSLGSNVPTTGSDPNTQWTEAEREYIEQAIDAANASGSKQLSINALDGNLIRTFTWFKDAIYYHSYDAGSLTVTKQSTGDLANPSDEFTFKVTLTGDEVPSGSQKYGDYVFTDGVTEITLKAGESATIKGIPAGTAYTVEETDAKGYVSTATGAEGTIAADATATAAFTNDKSTPTCTTGGFVATKTLTGADIADYTFTFQVKDADGNIVDTATNDAEGKIAFSKNMTLPEGEYVYYVSEVNDGQDHIVYDDTQYKVTVKVTKDENGKLGALWYIEDGNGNSVSKIAFVNSYDDGATGTTTTETPTTSGKSLPRTGDPTSVASVVSTLVAGAGAGTAGIILRRRKH